MHPSSNLGTPTQDNAFYQDPFMYCAHTQSLIREDDRALKTLARSISLSQNRFSLIFVRCDRSPSHILRLLHERYQILPNTLNIPGTATQLYPYIQDYWESCEQRHLPALWIAGLNAVIHLDELLVATNQLRNQFRQQFPFPIVLEVNRAIIQKLIKLAPDLYNWASTPLVMGRSHPDRSSDTSSSDTSSSAKVS